MNPAVEYRRNDIHHWVVQSARQAGSPYDFSPSPPASLYLDEGELATTLFAKRKRDEESDDEQEGDRPCKIRLWSRSEDDDGTVKDVDGEKQGKETHAEGLNKRDFRVILSEVYQQTELIESDVANSGRSEDVESARTRLKIMKGFLEVAMDRLDRELGDEASVEPSQEDIGRDQGVGGSDDDQ